MQACIAAAVAALLAVSSPPSGLAANTAASAICAASARHGIHPAWLVALVATENPDFLADGRGGDTGLFQINLRWQGWRFANADPHDYYVQADAAATIIRENLDRFGNTWRAIAAYNSWRHAARGDRIALRYWRRWRQALARIAPFWTRAVETAESARTGGGDG